MLLVSQKDFAYLGEKQDMLWRGSRPLGQYRGTPDLPKQDHLQRICTEELESLKLTKGDL